MSSTLVTMLDISLTDRTTRRKVTGFRTSHGDLDAYNLITIQLGLGEDKEFDFVSFFYAYVRDALDVTFTDDTGASAVFKNRYGTIAFPGSGKIKLSVAADSTIQMDRQIQVVYS